jgi:hypothetical protein
LDTKSNTEKLRESLKEHAGDLKELAQELPGPKTLQGKAQDALSSIPFGKEKSSEECRGLASEYASLCLLSYERPTFLSTTLRSLRGGSRRTLSVDNSR